MNNFTAVFPAIPASLTGQALVSHAWLGMLAGFLNALKFRKLSEDRFSHFVPAIAVHRPGKIIGSLTLMLAACGEQVTDVDQLRAAPTMFGTVASDATISRFMARGKDQPEAFSHEFVTMQRTLRSKVWTAAGKRSPARRATAEDPLIIDLDVSLVHVHSEKENAAPTYKGGYGYSPLIAMADYGAGNGTGEVLAILMRPGNRGANSVRDHIEVLSQALAQLPEEFYDEHGELTGEKILVRTDRAGASREFLNHLHSLGLQFSTTIALPVANERWIGWINEKEYWEPGDSVSDQCATVQRRVLDARHRARGRCESRIKTLKNSGLGKFPYHSYVANSVWADLAMFAMNLIAWLQLSALPSGRKAGCWDMKRWRYRLFSMAGKVVRGGRQTRLLLPNTAPEATPIIGLFESVQHLQHHFKDSILVN